MELIAEKRQTTGKKVRNLRDNGILPGVMFGKGFDSVALNLNYMDFEKVFSAVGETNLIDLIIDKDTHKILIKEIQMDPISDRFLHVGFYKPNLTEKVEVNVPVEVIGEDNNELIESGEAVVLTLLQEITIRALPTELKDRFVIDVSNIAEIGDAVTVAQLDYDRDKIEIVDVEEDEAVVRLDYAVMEEKKEKAALTEEELIEGIEATEEIEEEGEEGEEKTSRETEPKQEASE